jgi:flagellar protein FlaG
MNPIPPSVAYTASTPVSPRLPALGVPVRASPIEPAAMILRTQTALQNDPHLPLTATEEELRKALEKINDFVQTANEEIHFVLHEEYERWVVRIMDVRTDEIVRQIPSEQALAISKALDTLQGLLIREESH